jgi:hypothetical protein
MFGKRGVGGRSSVVEHQLPKLSVVGSIPIARSNFMRRVFDLVTTGLDPVVHGDSRGRMDCRVKPGNDERE